MSVRRGHVHTILSIAALAVALSGAAAHAQGQVGSTFGQSSAGPQPSLDQSGLSPPSLDGAIKVYPSPQVDPGSAPAGAQAQPEAGASAPVDTAPPVAAPAPAEPVAAEAPAPPARNGAPPWAVVLVALAALAVGGLLFRGRRP